MSIRPTIGVALTAAVLMTACAAPAAPATNPPTAAPSASVTTAASGSPTATGPALLGDILFTVKPNDVDGSDVIYAMSVDGSRPLRRIYYAGWMPDLSPDGKTIAFSSEMNASNMDIWTMNADGSNAQQLTHNDFNGFRAVFSPDGIRIVFNGDPGGIYIVNSDGTGQKQIASGAESASWSPDGKKLVYIDNRNGYDDIYTMNPDGTEPTRLTNDPAGNGIPAWSPDGKLIAFPDARSGISDLYVMNADGTNLKQLTADADVENWPAWSPDGTQIVFERRVTVMEFPGSPADIWVINADGTNPRNLTPNTDPDSDAWPSWR